MTNRYFVWSMTAMGILLLAVGVAVLLLHVGTETTGVLIMSAGLCAVSAAATSALLIGERLHVTSRPGAIPRFSLETLFLAAVGVGAGALGSTTEIIALVAVAVSGVVILEARVASRGRRQSSRRHEAD